jgi:glucokinase
MPDSLWHLIGDIGGTNARFGLARQGERHFQHVATYQVSDYPDFGDVLNHLNIDIERLGLTQAPLGSACLAVAGPPHLDLVSFTNSSWQFTRDLVSERTGATEVMIINDFAAAARALSALQPEELVQIGGGQPNDDSPKVAIGPGTGLGVAALLKCAHGAPIVLSGEGGHVDFAPVTDDEAAVLSTLRSRFGRVSVERVCCGDGIVNIYQALSLHRGLDATLTKASSIGEAARQGDSLAKETMAMFFSILGSAAGNVALTYGALGGVYIAGGIAPRYIDLLRRSDFRARFLAKGRFADYVSGIPTYVVTHEGLGLLGATLTLEDQQ